jgi:hypothetical protein
VAQRCAQGGDAVKDEPGEEGIQFTEATEFCRSIAVDESKPADAAAQPREMDGDVDMEDDMEEAKAAGDAPAEQGDGDEKMDEDAAVEEAEAGGSSKAIFTGQSFGKVWPPFQLAYAPYPGTYVVALYYWRTAGGCTVAALAPLWHMPVHATAHTPHRKLIWVLAGLAVQGMFGALNNLRETGALRSAKEWSGRTNDMKAVLHPPLSPPQSCLPTFSHSTSRVTAVRGFGAPGCGFTRVCVGATVHVRCALCFEGDGWFDGLR